MKMVFINRLKIHTTILGLIYPKYISTFRNYALKNILRDYMNIRECIARDISIPEALIDEAISVARAHVKIFHIKKKSGGSRKIFHPSKKLKTIQYWLIHSVFKRMTIHDAAMAYHNDIFYTTQCPTT